MRYKKSSQGITVVETLIAVAIFAIVGVAFVQIYTRILSATNTLRLRNIATFVATTEFEIIRNLPYASVGVSGGVPDGVLQATKVVDYNGLSFTVTPTVRNYDDPFDGTIGGDPNDLSPADGKLVELSITCTNCDDFTPVVYTTRVSPLNLETTSTNGSLRVKVFDAAGLPVVGASVSITNQAPDPDIVINDTTDNNGELLIVDTIPGVEDYEITVTKSGYSTERTYADGESGIVTPVKPHATVALQQLTQSSFAIDQTSTLNISTVTPTCSAVGSVDYQLVGSKLIGTDPDVLKYDSTGSTNGSGTASLTSMEWDTYTLTETDSAYDAIGFNPISPFSLDPNATQDIQIVVQAADPSTAVVVVTDQATGLPLDGASVQLANESGYDETQQTGEGFVLQTDWSGGSGQDDYVDTTRYFSASNIDTSNPVGELKLDNVLGVYLSSGQLISSSFDLGTTANLSEIRWEPQAQPPEVGTDPVRFQVATNNDNSTWDFKGPDGTGTSYYTLSNQTIHSSHDGDQYLRYKILLSTADTDFTPNVADISFTFSSDCTPPGQVAFSGLSGGTYAMIVSHPGYTSSEQDWDISSSWQALTVPLSP